MPSTALRQQLMGQVHRVVVKVGTAVLTGDDGQLDLGLIQRIGRQIGEVRQRGIAVTLVTSGAVGSGMGIAGLPRRPKITAMLQACAAIGQPSLMTLYAKALARHNLHAGQILVTRTDFEQRNRYVNIANTIQALERLGAVPILNENDPIATDELDKFADNDTIAALIANLLRAELLVLLTVVDGVLNAQGQRVDLISRVDADVLKLIRADRSKLGSGGMASKLNAARMVSEAGEAAVIASGREPNVLTRLLAGERIGTIIAPAGDKVSARHRWLRNAVRPAGKVVLDDGAAEAILRQGRSLLARGIVDVQGKFERGAIVSLVTQAGRIIAQGLSNYNHAELAAIKGRKSSEITAILGQKPFDEAIHRDNLALIAGPGT